MLRPPGQPTHPRRAAGSRSDCAGWSRDRLEASNLRAFPVLGWASWAGVPTAKAWQESQAPEGSAILGLGMEEGGEAFQSLGAQRSLEGHSGKAPWKRKARQVET